jgi:hypothetical protein
MQSERKAKAKQIFSKRKAKAQQTQSKRNANAKQTQSKRNATHIASSISTAKRTCLTKT